MADPQVKNIAYQALGASLAQTAANPATSLRQVEMKPTPRSPRMGMFGDAMMAVRDFANRLQIPQGVPLIGGEGVGSLLMGRAPEELVEMSYGNMPVRVNPYAGRTASFMPEMKPNRGAQVADLLSLAGVPGGGRTAAAAMGAADFGSGAERAIFIGSKSKTWDKNAAKKALDLEKAGASPESVWAETGTFRGADGKWRQEISDEAAMFKSQVSPITQQDEQAYQQARESLRAVEKQVSDAMRTGKYSLYSLYESRPYLAQAEQQARSVINNYKAKLAGISESSLPDVLQHQQLMQAYPEMQSIRVFEDSTRPGGASSLNKIEVGGNDQRSIMLHELQHDIQKQEGFALGGNPKMMRITGQEIADPKFVSGLKKWNEVLISEGYPKDKLFLPSDIKMNDPERLWDWIQQQGNWLETKRGKYAPEFDEAFPLGITPMKLDANEAYRRLAGEAEARAVQSRMDMTPEQRRAVYPYQSYDVPVEQLIIRQD